MIAVSTRGRRRHEKLAGDQLVPRRQALTLFDEAVDVRQRPAVSVHDWHRHNLLGVRNGSQLGTPKHGGPIRVLRHRRVARQSKLRRGA